VGPDHNWCSACGRSDNDVCAKCEALKVDLGHAQRFLAHESDLNKRLGEGNRELQKLLGVQYPGGINERALEIIAERDKLRQLLRDLIDFDMGEEPERDGLCAAEGPRQMERHARAWDAAIAAIGPRNQRRHNGDAP
jgi:hypothetical protein